MAGDTVQQIKDRLSIEDVVSQYLKLDRAGQTLRARCPFHNEKTPSFFVSPERGTFHCFGCGAGGDLFTFVEQIEGLDFKGALKVLAERSGVPLVYHTREGKDERDRLFELMETAAVFYASRLSAEAIAYLKERGLEDQTIKEFRLGLAGNGWSEFADYARTKKFADREIVEAGLAKKNERGSLVDKFRRRIMFPIADSAGRIIAFSGRLFAADSAGISSDAPKYLNSPETPLFRKSRVLYGFDRAKVAMRKARCAVLVEGQMDLLASHQAGWVNTIAVSGTAMTADHATLIKRMTDNLVVALDGDEAGIKAAARAARAALAAGLDVKVAALPQGLDPADLIRKEGPAAWRLAIREAKDIITFLLDAIEERSRQPDRFRRSVEAAVLPFLADVQSPIARAQYVKEIARRLGVGDEAVVEALQKTPHVPPPAVPASAAALGQKRSLDRLGHAFALLLWQEALAAPAIDTAQYRRELAEAVGDEEMRRLEGLPHAEREALRFDAERMLSEYPVERSARETLRLIKEERLRGKIFAAARALAEAEQGGASAEIGRLEAEVRLYTQQLAQLGAE